MRDAPTEQQEIKDQEVDMYKKFYETNKAAVEDSNELVRWEEDIRKKLYLSWNSFVLFI